jgi:glycosyltransferase involved in cell wall biosynthesis
MKDKVKLFYMSNERFPAKLACTIQQMAMCEAFVENDAAVTLIYPRYFDAPKLANSEILDFYSVEKEFRLKTLPSLLSLSKPLVDGKKRIRVPVIGGLSVLFSGWALAFKMWLNGALNQPTIIYSRSVNIAYAFYALKKSVARKKPITIAFEVHSLDQQTPKKYFYALLRNADVLVCISHALKTALIEKMGSPPEKIYVAPDGVKKSFLTTENNKQNARQTLGLPNKRIVLYTGQLLPGKGAHVFVNAVEHFDDDVMFLLVGGHGDYLRRMQNHINENNILNVTVTGFVSPALIPLYQAAADVLVLPATADHDISAYTSPLKLFEYMSSRRPIVASDLPVLKEILEDGENALIFAERNEYALAEKIKLLLKDATLASQLAERAFVDVQQLTWDERAKRILYFLRLEERKDEIK